MNSVIESMSSLQPKTVTLAIFLFVVFVYMETALYQHSNGAVAHWGHGHEDDLFNSMFDDSGPSFDRPAPSVYTNSAAPRTHDGEYNLIEDDKKYLVYTPSGGFNNQRRELVYALDLGRAFKRTVVVPMGARHTSMWHAYFELDMEDLLPMDRLLDFEQIAKFTPVVPLNITLRRFIHETKGAYEGQFKIRRLPATEPWSPLHRELLIKYRHATEKFLIFQGAFYHQRMSRKDRGPIIQSVPYSKYIRDMGIRMSKSIAPVYNSMHLRLGDYHLKPTQNGAHFYRMSLAAHFEKDIPLYIATEIPKSGSLRIYDPLPRVYNVSFAKNLPQDLLDEFNSIFPPGKIRNDMFGLVEQMICANSKRFVGTGFSTFTQYILFIRENREFVFPEIASLEQFNTQTST